MDSILNGDHSTSRLDCRLGHPLCFSHETIIFCRVLRNAEWTQGHRGIMEFRLHAVAGRVSIRMKSDVDGRISALPLFGRCTSRYYRSEHVQSIYY
jgi:hypothetical protein